MEIRERVLKHADGMFMKYGVRSVTMDDIASGLGISKKTIYQYFNNKADIVYAVTEEHFRQEESFIENIVATSENAIEEMAKIVLWSVQNFKNISSNLIHEVRKYYPKAWQLFEHHKSGFVLRLVRDNLARGLKEGIYRKSINPEIISRMRIAQIDFSLNEGYFPTREFDFKEVQIQLMEMYMYGLVSEKGRSLLAQYLASKIVQP